MYVTPVAKGFKMSKLLEILKRIKLVAWWGANSINTVILEALILVEKTRKQTNESDRLFGFNSELSRY